MSDFDDLKGTYLNELVPQFLSDQLQTYTVHRRPIDNQKLLKDFLELNGRGHGKFSKFGVFSTMSDLHENGYTCSVWDPERSYVIILTENYSAPCSQH